MINYCWNWNLKYILVHSAISFWRKFVHHLLIDIRYFLKLDVKCHEHLSQIIIRHLRTQKYFYYISITLSIKRVVELSTDLNPTQKKKIKNLETIISLNWRFLRRYIFLSRPPATIRRLADIRTLNVDGINQPPRRSATGITGSSLVSSPSFSPVTSSSRIWNYWARETLSTLWRIEYCPEEGNPEINWCLLRRWRIISGCRFPS